MATGEKREPCPASPPYDARVAKTRKGHRKPPPGARPRRPAEPPFAAASLIGLTGEELLDRLCVEHLSSAASWKLWNEAAKDVRLLQRGLRHTEAKVRATCARILDHFLDDAAIADLIECLDDPSPEVRAWALHTLGCDRCKEGACRPGEAAFSPAAIRLARDDPSANVRRVAIETLARSSARRTEPVLAAIAQVKDADPNPRLRKFAARWFALCC